MTEASEYCRELETYLCRKNEGHLVRIVGPAFEQVCGWAARGVPLAIAFRGIDQYCERYYAKGPRRRPVRIEFCEADILDLFDDWRRAVGVTRDEDVAEQAESHRGTLPAHLDRAIARLTALRSGSTGSGERSRFSERFVDLVETLTRELDATRARAKQARGEERSALIARLSTLDRSLVEAAIAELPDARRASLRQEADTEIAPFAARMSREARAQAARSAFERLVRQEAGVPGLTFE
jgi:hypothetical protein